MTSLGLTNCSDSSITWAGDLRANVGLIPPPSDKGTDALNRRGGDLTELARVSILCSPSMQQLGDDRSGCQAEIASWPSF
jgi:hypothetical protein